LRPGSERLNDKKGAKAMHRLKIWTALCTGAIFLLLLASQAHALFGGKFEDEVETEKTAVGLHRETVRGCYKLVRGDTLKRWMDAGKDMVIVDTMPYEASYREAHVPGARQFLFPKAEMTSWDTEETAGKSKADYRRLLGGDTGKTVVVYCGFVKCGRSHNGAMWAVKLGYDKVYRFPGGIFAWKGYEFPVEQAE